MDLGNRRRDRSLQPSAQDILVGTAYCVLLTCIAGGVAWWLWTSSAAWDREYKCSRTVTAMAATAEDVRARPAGGWPDGAEVDLTSRYPYLADLLEQAGCPDTLAKLRQGEPLPSSASPPWVREFRPND
ncbi:hypothetical protein [Reyranella sp.]|jgi:hypothetical protein|uniref:hypothetical protein n=1 Tax=Reyranella sp. TaxID=1929291 RepID=UPI002F9577B3